MRVLIIGATGNVGSALVRRLRSGRSEVQIVGLARRPARDPDVEWVAADLRTADLDEVLRGVDTVIHLAWQLQPQRKPAVTWSVNVGGTDRLLGAIARSGVERLVYASSVGAYAPGPDRAVVESWPTHGVPTCAYSREKAYVERMLDTFEHEHPDVRVVRLRPALIFQRAAGSEVRRLFLGSLFPNALARPGTVPVLPVADGIRFQAVHSDDIADAYARACALDVRGAFNIAAEPVLGLRDVADVLGARPVRVPLSVLRAGAAAAWRLRLHPVEPGWVDLAARSPLLDTQRARTELGWEPRRSGREALRELLVGIADRAGGDTPTLTGDDDVRRASELSTGQGASYDRDLEHA